MPEAAAGVSHEVDPEYLEHARLQALDEQDQTDLPWDARSESEPGGPVSLLTGSDNRVMLLVIGSEAVSDRKPRVVETGGTRR